MNCQGQCEPVEQIRGQMGPGDYYDVIASNKGATGSVPEPELYGYAIYDGDQIPEDIQPHHCVEMNPSIAESFRICCKKCGKASPWGAKDFPGMPGAGADYTRKKWNEGHA
jgi:hypothetical protein